MKECVDFFLLMTNFKSFHGWTKHSINEEHSPFLQRFFSSVATL